MSDVARRAGVHAATGSRALRNDPRITPPQREKIRRLAAAEVLQWARRNS
jgi:DNA-binding LacI/PurR family transcriptional regulator